MKGRGTLTPGLRRGATFCHPLRGLLIGWIAGIPQAYAVGLAYVAPPGLALAALDMPADP